jgi:hypothetical protein
LVTGRAAARETGLRAARLVAQAILDDVDEFVRQARLRDDLVETVGQRLQSFILQRVRRQGEDLQYTTTWKLSAIDTTAVS